VVFPPRSYATTTACGITGSQNKNVDFKDGTPHEPNALRQVVINHFKYDETWHPRLCREWFGLVVVNADDSVVAGPDGQVRVIGTVTEHFVDPLQSRLECYFAILRAELCGERKHEPADNGKLQEKMTPDTAAPESRHLQDLSGFQ
jgi:hypothetical protein